MVSFFISFIIIVGFLVIPVFHGGFAGCASSASTLEMESLSIHLLLSSCVLLFSGAQSVASCGCRPCSFYYYFLLAADSLEFVMGHQSAEIRA